MMRTIVRWRDGGGRDTLSGQLKLRGASPAHGDRRPSDDQRLIHSDQGLLARDRLALAEGAGREGEGRLRVCFVVKRAARPTRPSRASVSQRRPLELSRPRRAYSSDSSRSPPRRSFREAERLWAYLDTDEQT